MGKGAAAATPNTPEPASPRLPTGSSSVGLERGTSSTSVGGLRRTGTGTGTYRRKSAVLQADQIDSFSLSQPPPFDVNAAELVRTVLDGLPSELRCPASRFDVDAGSKEACVLATHTFWYLFVSLQLPHLGAERDELLRLMALQFARLSLALTCPRDAFFTYFPPLIGLTQIAALRRHGVLTDKAEQGLGALAAGVIRHVVALLGGAPLSADSLKAYMRVAERPPNQPGAPVAQLSERAPARRPKGEPQTQPWKYELPKGPPVPALARAIIPALPSVVPEPLPESPGNKRGGAPGGLPLLGRGASSSSEAAQANQEANKGGAWGRVRTLAKAQRSIAVVKSTRDAKQLKSASESHLLPSGGRHYRPPRVSCDLQRQSPLVAIFKGAAPSDVVGVTDFGPLGSRSGFSKPGESLPAGPTLRLCAPGVGGRTRLGGAASFQALQPAGMVERGRRRLTDFQQTRRDDEMTMTIFERALDHRCDEIDRQRDGKLDMPPPQLADYTLDLVERSNGRMW